MANPNHLCLKKILTLFLSAESFVSTDRRPLAAAGFCSDLLHKPSPSAPPNVQLLVHASSTRSSAGAAFGNEGQPAMDGKWQ